MPQELDLGSIAISINLVAEQLEQTADSAVAKLNAVGEQGLAAQQKINPLSASLNQVGKSIDNVKFEKLTNKLGDLNTKFSAQQNLAVRLGAELDEMASSYVALEKAAGRSGDIDVSKVFPVQSAELDKEIAKLDELQQQIKITTQERQAAAEAAVQAAQKQAQAADQAVHKQQQLNQKLADKTATNSTKLGMDAAAMSIRGVSSAAGGTVGNLGYLATEVMFLKRTMTAGAGAAATFAAALSFGVMAAVTIVTSAIKAFQKQQEKLKKAEEERQRTFEEGVRNLQQYGKEVEVLSRNLNTLKDATSTTAQLTSARNELAGTFADLIVGYTDEDEAILANNEAIERYISNLEDAARLDRDKVLNTSKTAVSDYNAQAKAVKELTDEVEKYQWQVTVYENAVKQNPGNTAALAALNSSKKSFDESTTKLIDARSKLMDATSTMNERYSAFVLNNLEVEDPVSGVIKAFEDLDRKTQTVVRSYILNTDDAAKSTEDWNLTLNMLSANLSDSAWVDNQYANIIQMLESDKAAAALEELNQKINNQISSLGDLKGAYSSLANGQQLSLEQLYELSNAYPTVARYIAETGDLTLRKGEILAEVYSAERETFLAEQQMRLDQIKGSRESLNATLIEAKGKIEAYKAVAAATGVMNVSDYVYWETVAAQADKSLAKMDEIESLMNSISGIDITSGGGSSSYRNEALQEELKLLDHRKRMNQLTYEEELAWLEKIQATLINNDEERRDMEYRIYALKKSHADELQKLADKEVSALDDLGKAVTDALKAQYDAQRKAEESRISESVKAWKNWETSTVDAIQGQIKALDDLEKQQNSQEAAAEYARKTQELKLQLAYENDDYQRKQIEKQLNALAADEQKRLRQEEIEAEKSALQEEITAAKEKSSSQQELLKSELDNLNDYYDERTSAAALQAEAERIIMDNNQQEIVSLIRSYAPDYAMAGETLGSRMVEAFKKKVADIVSYVEDITDRINDYTGSVAAVANSAADNFIAKMYGNQAASSTKTTSVYQTVNIKQPVTSPIQAARALADVSQSLAKQISGG